MKYLEQAARWAFIIVSMTICWSAIFFALELYALRGGFLHQAVCAMTIYLAVTGLLLLHRRVKP